MSNYIENEKKGSRTNCTTTHWNIDNCRKNTEIKSIFSCDMTIFNNIQKLNTQYAIAKFGAYTIDPIHKILIIKKQFAKQTNTIKIEKRKFLVIEFIILLFSECNCSNNQPKMEMVDYFKKSVILK